MAIDFGVASNETVWRPEPTTRGTFGLLSSCVITMILCIWTSLHLNIPDVDEPRIKYLPPRHTLRKAYWVLIGLFAPEFVAWVAYEQFRDARHLRNRMNELLFEKRTSDVEALPGVEGGGRKNKWTLTHGFYANMGGFVFDADVLQQAILPQGRKRVTLTSLGMVELAKIAPHLVPDISIAHIRDKSKANGFAKTIAVLQATWFGAQCISRLALGMTTSLLELNTLAHALLMRCIGLDFKVMPYRGRVSLVYEKHGTVCRRRGHSYGVSGFFLGMRKNRNEKFFGNQSSGIGLDPDEDGQGSHQNHGCRLYIGHSLLGFAFSRRDQYRYHIRPSQQEFSTPLTIKRSYVVLTKSDISRFSMAQQCYERHPSLAQVVSSKEKHLDLVPGVSSTDDVWHQESVVYRSSNLVRSSSRTPGSDYESRTAFLLSLFIASLAYGSLHLLAWNPPVRSQAEVLIWRISGISITAFVPAILSAVYLLISLCYGGVLVSQFVTTIYQEHTLEETKRRWEWWIDRYQDVKGLLGIGAVIVLVVITATATGLYVAGRVYLVVECFISVARLPPSVFETPTWSQYFPHLS